MRPRSQLLLAAALILLAGVAALCLWPRPPAPLQDPAATPTPPSPAEDAAPPAPPADEDLDQAEPAPPRGALVAERPRPALPPPPPGRVLLRVGEQALRQGWHATAYRRCKAAGELAGDHRPAALLCQGRAALGMRWPQRAAFLAQRALDLRPGDVAALVLLGDAQDCRQARPVYLRALELQKDDAGALEGLRRCRVDLPGPAPDLTAIPPPRPLALHTGGARAARRGRRQHVAARPLGGPPRRRRTFVPRRRGELAAGPAPAPVETVLQVLRHPQVRALIIGLIVEAIRVAEAMREEGRDA